MIESSILRFILGAFLMLPIAANSDTFSIVQITDSQYYSERHPEIMEAQIDWIVANEVSENIIYVAQTGDLKDDSSCDNKTINVGSGAGRTEWQIANQAFTDLDNANIAYAVVPGNHDFDPVSGGCPNWSTQRPLANYNTLFGPGRFAGDPFYGDPATLTPGNRVTGSNEDNFTLFDSNGVKFIAINLAFKKEPDAIGITKLELPWADNLLKTYPDRLGIVTSHYFMETNPGNNLGPYGQEVYDTLSNNRNLFMMLAGHWYGEAWRTETTGRAGLQPVQIMMANYQAMQFPDDTDPVTPPGTPTPNPAFIDFSSNTAFRGGAGSTDSGYMRIMRFDTDTGMVDIETFIPPVVPIKNRTSTIVSTYSPGSGAGMGEFTASNLSFSFAGYVPLPSPPPFQLTGSLVNDQFVRFLAGTTISESDVNSRCADRDGCRITLTRVYGTTSPVVFGPTNFSYDPGTNQFQVLASDGTVISTGINANAQTEAIVGLQANTNCWFSDWDTSGTGSNGDRNGNWSVLILNTTATNLTCTIRIDD